MKIIDAHMHYFNIDRFAEVAQQAGHENSAACWERICQENNIVFAVAMGNTYSVSKRYGGVAPRLIDLAAPYDEEHFNQPAYMGYCLGVESEKIAPFKAKKTAKEFEWYLRREQHCVGIKLYPGYNAVYVNDKRHWPLFELAEHYDVPVVIHTGDTARPCFHLKYSHPLTVDDAAANFPKVRFVIAHCGNPWIMDAVEVAAKNPNVNIDLSGLLAGKPDVEELFRVNNGYFSYITTWLNYLGDYSRFMYGSDWPLINIPTYIECIKRLIPEQYQEDVFYNNALRTFKRINNLL